MEDKNLELYNRYKEVPKNALKEFSNGNFSGTDINTMWRIKSLTEEFGICGFGWYYEIIKLWTETGINDEVLAFAEIKLYIKIDNEWSNGISATGGSKIVRAFSKYTQNNDEGFKMALTDALGVACKFLGFGADVYWANDKTKYTNTDNENNKKSIKITAEQIKKLEELDVNFDKLCKYFKKTNINDLTYSEAKEAIEAKQIEIMKNLPEVEV